MADQAPPTAAQEFSTFGQGAAGYASAISSLVSALPTSTQKKGNLATTGTRQLEIDEAGINKILQDILGSTQGLASVFSDEQIAGIYDSSVSAQASGDLLTKLVGEIAKLTAVEKTTGTETSSGSENSKKKGYLGAIGTVVGSYWGPVGASVGGAIGSKLDEKRDS